jgi:pilus assembly protein CpaE
MLAAKAGIQARGSEATSAARGPFLASIVDDVTRETVKAAVAQLGWQDAKCRVGGAKAALDLIEADSPPSLLVVDVSDSDDPLDAIDALIGRCGPGTRMIAIGLMNDVGLYRRLIEMGVADYLVKPVQSQTLLDAIQNAVRGDRPEPAPARAARVIAVVGARGGVGATTVAVSCAWTLSKDKRQRVVLLDLDLHLGSLALSLDLEPSRGLREILGNPDRVDGLLIRSAMSNAGERLRVLAAEEPLEDTVPGGSAGLDALLTELASNTDCVVVDVPRALSPLGRHALGIADVVCIVSEQSLPAMRDTQRLLSLIKAMRSDAKTVVVANRVGGIPAEVGRTDFERGIGAKVDFAIPVDIKGATAAAERAKAFVDVAREARTQNELRKLGAALGGAGHSAKGSLLKRMFGK